jgi:hypothetical protein
MALVAALLAFLTMAGAAQAVDLNGPQSRFPVSLSEPLLSPRSSGAGRPTARTGSRPTPTLARAPRLAHGIASCCSTRRSRLLATPPTLSAGRSCTSTATWLASICATPSMTSARSCMEGPGSSSNRARSTKPFRGKGGARAPTFRRNSERVAWRCRQSRFRSRRDYRFSS